jgi:Ras-related protein Rab-8A
MARLENTAQPPLVKLLLLGDAGVGKTCLRLRFAKGAFFPAEDAAAGETAAFSVAHVDVNGRGVSVQLWDGGAAEQISGLSYHGVVAVFDVTNSATLASAAAQPALKSAGDGRLLRILVGTKCDRSDRAVTPAEGESMAQRHGMKYFEVSASTGAGVKEAFDAIILRAFQDLQLASLAAELGQTGVLHNMTMIHRTSGFGARAAAAGTYCCLV